MSPRGSPLWKTYLCAAQGGKSNDCFTGWAGMRTGGWAHRKIATIGD